MFQKDFFKEEHLDGKDRETDCAGRIEHDADLDFVFKDRLRWENYNPDKSFNIYLPLILQSDSS